VHNIAWQRISTIFFLETKSELPESALGKRHHIYIIIRLEILDIRKFNGCFFNKLISNYVKQNLFIRDSYTQLIMKDEYTHD
jgi:hypothetical protein